MFKKVLVVDDHASVNHGIFKTLTDKTTIPLVEFVKYCDDANIRFQKAQQDKTPFDLIITDLTFKADYRKQNIKDGIELIKVLRDKQPKIKIIIYSIEDRKAKIKAILGKYKINGFVSKGRYALKELLDCVNTIYNDDIYISKELNIDLHRNINYEIDDFDVMILEKLAKGFNQKEIVQHLQKEIIKPNSLSAIEKKINRLKILLKANNSIHLIAKAKDLGII